MNIKRIIREEINDMEWIEDVPNELPKGEKWVLVNDINVDSLEESELIQNYLFKQGFKWITGRSYYLAQKIYSIVANSRNNLPIIPTNQKGTLTYYGDSPHHIEEADEVIEIFKSEGKGIYYWSDIKPNVIMESNDMQWIEDTESPEEVTIKWLNDNLLKYKSPHLPGIKFMSKENPENWKIKQMWQKDNPQLDDDVWLDTVRLWLDKPHLGQFVNYDEYIKQKRSDINFDDVKEFMMSEFSIRRDGDGTWWIQYYQETDGFMGDNVIRQETDITLTDPSDGTVKNKINNSLIHEFGINLLDQVMEWLNNLTEEEVQEWMEMPVHIIPLKVARERT